MTTMLDVIRRVPQTVNRILDEQANTFADLCAKLKEQPDRFNELVYVGSGSSNTAAVAAVRIAEQASRLPARTMVPNDFLRKAVYNPDAIYVFVSQSGNSHLTCLAAAKAKELGLFTVAVSEKPDTPLAKMVDVYVNQHCEDEEYGMVTVGYCSSMLTQMVLGMNVGLATGKLSQEEFDAYLEDARKVPASHKVVTDKAVEWFEANKNTFLNKEGITFYGAGPLWGVALEGALKTFEVARKIMAIGFELDDGLHGPDMGYTDKHVVIFLNEAGKDEKLLQNGARFAKGETGGGFIFGKNPIDETDLAFEPASQCFYALEFAPAVETLAYLLAVEFGTPVYSIAEWTKENAPKSNKYFATHDQ